MELVSVIIVNWNSKHYLKKCIDSILNQSHDNIELIFIDNDSMDGSFEFVDKNYNNECKILKIRNINNGYAGGANKGISLANGEYIAILNPDIILEKDYIKNCLEVLNEDKKVAAVTGKLLKYDFVNNRILNIIDSAGISVTKSRKCYDRGQNIKDEGQYNTKERVFAVCGAAPVFRKVSLQDVKIFNEYFDEDFFSYKEDIDLCWRLNIYGYKCMYTPYALAYHGRGMNGARGIINFINNRKKQSKFLRQLSFRNHYLMLIKNETNFTYNRDKFKITMRLLIFLIYSLIFERFNFSMIQDIKSKYKLILDKRKIIMKNCNISLEEQFNLFNEN